jgi:hypothetical protein
MSGTEQMGLFLLIICYVFPVAASLWVGILSTIFTHYSYLKLADQLKRQNKREMTFGHVVVGVFSLVASLGFATGIFFSILLFRALIG